MKQALQELSQDRRFKLPQARIALLLILLAAGLGLLAWTVIPDAPVAATQENGAGAARDYPPKDQLAVQSESLDEILAQRDRIPTHDHPLLGRHAPDCELVDTEGKVWNLGKLLDDGPVVLIFYYGYHCIHCVRHLSEVNRDLPLFNEVGARVVAISADSPELTRRKFEKNGRFGFPVLSDPGNKVAQAYGVFRPAQDGRIAAIFRHGTFVIDQDGTVQWVNIGDAPFRRNPALLFQLAKIGGTLP